MRKIIVLLFVVLFFVSCVTCPPAPDLSVCFSPHYCDVEIVKDIDEARLSIDLMVNELTSTSITYAIYRAKLKGVDIRIIADKEKSLVEHSQITSLTKEGYDIKLLNDGVMYNSVLIIDDVILYVGSSGFNKKYRYNNLLRIINCNIIEKYKKEFEALWTK